MWISDSFSISEQYLKVYSPVKFLKKYDRSGKFIRKYIPELNKFPNKYIFTPWLAPLSVQIKSDCIVGIDYPKPIVDHNKFKKNAENKHNIILKNNSTSKFKKKKN